jgi:uncharacterized protein (DUF58 family)
MRDGLSAPMPAPAPGTGPRDDARRWLAWPASLAARVEGWWLQRLPRTDRWTLTQSNIYIVPTKAGAVFALVLLVMLVASINYQLSLGYVLTFLLAGSGLVSIQITHRTLRGLTLQLRTTGPGFAGEAAIVEVLLSSPAQARHGIGVSFNEAAARRAQAWVDVPALGLATARLSFVPPHRGLHEVPTLRAETRFPFGLFRAWTVWRPQGTVLAWPKPEYPAPGLPPVQARPGDTTQSYRSASGEFEGVRAYRRGDSPKHVLWKKAARTGELVTRDSRGSATSEMWLDWQGMPGQPVEARLSRLAAWVQAADSAGVVYGLRLPGLELAPDHGDVHRRRTLEALALWH